MQILKSRFPSTADLRAAQIEGEAKANVHRSKIADLEAQALEMLAGEDGPAKKWRKAIAEQREELDLIEQRLALLGTKLPEAEAREAHNALIDERKKAVKSAGRVDDLTEKYKEKSKELAAILTEMRDQARAIYGFNSKMRDIADRTSSTPIGLERIEEPEAIKEPRQLWDRVQLPSVVGWGAQVDGIHGYWPPAPPKAEAIAAE